MYLPSVCSACSAYGAGFAEGDDISMIPNLVPGYSVSVEQVSVSPSTSFPVQVKFILDELVCQIRTWSCRIWIDLDW